MINKIHAFLLKLRPLQIYEFKNDRKAPEFHPKEKQFQMSLEVHGGVYVFLCEIKGRLFLERGKEGMTVYRCYNARENLLLGRPATFTASG